MKFIDYLKEVHWNMHPKLIDDDITDKFNDWLGELQADDFIHLAEKWQEKKESLEMIDEKIKYNDQHNLIED